MEYDDCCRVDVWTIKSEICHIGRQVCNKVTFRGQSALQAANFGSELSRIATAGPNLQGLSGRLFLIQCETAWVTISLIGDLHAQVRQTLSEVEFESCPTWGYSQNGKAVFHFYHSTMVLDSRTAFCHLQLVRLAKANPLLSTCSPRRASQHPNSSFVPWQPWALAAWKRGDDQPRRASTTFRKQTPRDLLNDAFDSIVSPPRTFAEACCRWRKPSGGPCDFAWSKLTA